MNFSFSLIFNPESVNLRMEIDGKPKQQTVVNVEDGF
jgi:hypothetical protein